jgi:predicted TIM-barrel fold metal-dependent hydrolase
MERIIDVHVHDVPLSRKLPALFQQLTGRHQAGEAWRERVERAKLSELIDDMDRAGVTTSLVVLHEETDEFLHLAAQHPGRLFALAYFDSLSPRQGLERIRALCDVRPDLILGVETALLLFHQDPRIRDFVPLYEFCLERELPVQFQLGGVDTAEAAARPTAFGVLAASYPRLKIVCLHPGGPWHPELPGLLRQFPNVFLAVTGLQGCEAGKDGSPRMLRELFRQSGSRTVMVGSDWPEWKTTYVDGVKNVRGLPWWQRRNVCWRTAARVYGARILEDRTTHTEPLSSTR